jgi:hypothetical protein
MSQPSFRPFDPAHDSEEIVALLTGEEWIYRPQRQISAEVARKELADGRYEGPDVLTLIIELDGEVVGTGSATRCSARIGSRGPRPRSIGTADQATSAAASRAAIAPA